MKNIKPICVKCQCFYRPKKNGVFLTEMMPKHNNAERGIKDPGAWMPYKVWVGDLWECPDCNHQIIEGVNGPLAERHHHYMESMRARSEYDVNDC